MKKEDEKSKQVAALELAAQLAIILAVARLGERLADAQAAPQYVTGERPFGKTLSTKTICLN